MSRSPLRRRLLTALVAVALAAAGIGLDSVTSAAAPADCGSTCLGVVGVASLPSVSSFDNLGYSFTITNHGADDTLTSFTLKSTRGVSCVNGTCALTVNGVAVPYADLAYSPGQNPTAKITFPTPIQGDGGQATISFTLGEPFTSSTATTSTTLAVTSQSGQSATSSEIDTPYPTVDLAARYIGDNGFNDLFLGNSKAIGMQVPVFSDGTGPSPRARFTFTLGAGWSAKATAHATGPTVSCTHAGTVWTCDEQTPVDNSVSLQAITLVPAATSTVNAVRNVHVHIDPIGVVDQVPSNNDVTLHVKNTGTADTGRTVSVATTKLKVGGRTKVTVVVANRGPQTTNGLRVLVLHDGTQTTDHVVLSSGKGAGFFQGYDGDGVGYEWLLPAIKSGHRLTATFTLTGKAKGKGWVSVTTHAVTYDPGTAGVAVRSAVITVS